MSQVKPKILIAEMSRHLHEGPAQYALRLLREFDTSRFVPVPVFSLEDDEFQKLESMFDFPVYNISMPRPKIQFNPVNIAMFAMRTSSSVNELFDLIKDENIQIVHGNSIINLHVAIAAARAELPFVMSVHEIMPDKRINNTYIRWICEKAHVVHTVSAAVKGRLIEAGVPHEKIEVVTNGIEIVEVGMEQRMALRREFKIPEAAPVVGMVGTITELKGQHVLVAAMPDLLESFPDLRAVIVGDAMADSEEYFSQLRETAERECPGRVIFTGRRDDARAFMSLFDVHLQPSVRGDSFPLTVLEAMSVGTPTVGSRVGGIPEMVRNRVTGYLVPPDSPQSLAPAVGQILGDRDLRFRMGRKARLRIVNEFAADKQIRRIMDLYEMSFALRQFE